jgi:hypothetical protein
MTADENNTTWLHTMVSVWDKVRSNRIVRAIIWLRWVITVAGFLATMLWYSYLEGQDISGDLSADYAAVQKAQKTLLDDSLLLHQQLLNPKASVDLDAELSELREMSRNTIGSLAGLRAPTNSLAEAQIEYRKALEQLIATANRLERGEIQGMAGTLQSGLQGVSNAGGKLNQMVRNFQGGMWPQLMGSIF